MKPNVGNLVDPEFLEFYESFHSKFSAHAFKAIEQRREILERTKKFPDWKPKARGECEKAGSPPRRKSTWKVSLPTWCRDQRNQMTGPADSAELVVKMINSGSPGVMLDLEDSMANNWESLQTGYDNIVQALHGSLSYEKRGETHEITGNPVVWSRVRGLHLTQVVNGRLTSAPLFDIANLVWRIKPDLMDKPLCIYIPKTEHPAEAAWWSEVLKHAARSVGLEDNYIKCMALVESYPMACDLRGFIGQLRDHLLGLNLGRWDYMASWIDWNSEKEFLLPDRNSIPHDAAFFQNLRHHLVQTCHEFGILAIGGMTALYPSRSDKELNDRALTLLAKDKANEASCGFDGAWTGHPDQNDIAVGAFPAFNQLDIIPDCPIPDLLDVSDMWDRATPLPMTIEGLQDCIRVSVRYRNGVINGRGAVLLDGYMEDLATDRICRLMVAQRLQHEVVSKKQVEQCFAQVLDSIIALAHDTGELGTEATLRQAAEETKQLIYSQQHNPA
tara:strand:+ start:66651 stop:68153 length:1503 start_codon:yes stop_codon:yes gene_type:complete